jgi:hypothetical protein
VRVEPYKWWYDRQAYLRYHLVANIVILLLGIHMEWYGITKRLPDYPWYVALGDAGFRASVAMWMLWIIKYIVLIMAALVSMGAYTTPEQPFLNKRFAIRMGLRKLPKVLALIAIPLIVGYFGPLPRG